MTIESRMEADATTAANRGSVVGDFVVAIGSEAEALLPAPAGFAPVESGNARARVLARGDFWRAASAIALADLVQGHCGDAKLDAAPIQGAWRGRFVHAQWNADGSKLAAATDHFGSVPLYALSVRDTLLVATDLRLLLASRGASREVDLEAIYHYLNFSCIPAPRTICRDIRRIEPGTRLVWTNGRVEMQRYFVPEYPQDLGGTESALAEQLLDRISRSVRDFCPGDPAGWGCFLSGGTDSSSIVTIASRALAPQRVDTFSIGFGEQGYDELAYARIAADAAGARAWTEVVDSGRTLDLVNASIRAYDQPFGNASSIPTMVCAELARAHDVDLMLAGDGGDEIFGGNQRYAKDRIMESYYALPPPLRAIGGAIGSIAGRSRKHFAQRVANFVSRSSLPNPDRFYTDDSFASDYYDELLSADFKSKVSRDASLDHMRDVYALGSAASPLHRIMRLDLLHAIAQNDLVKVHGACKAHGVTARFPYLDPALVAFTGRLPEKQKVRGLDKRHLFKLAMRSVLPEAVLKKKKQGFGLPIAVWLRENDAFRTFTRDVLDDRRTRERGWFNQPCIDRLIDEHTHGSWDHSAAIFQLVVLELWLREHLDAA